MATSAREAVRRGRLLLESGGLVLYNPNHGNDGRFASGPGEASGGSHPVVDGGLHGAVLRNYEAAMRSHFAFMGQREEGAVISPTRLPDGTYIRWTGAARGNNELAVPAAEGRGNVVTHTHPTDQPPSADDFATATAHGYAALRTITPHYTYTLAPHVGGRWPDGEAVARAFWPAYGRAGRAVMARGLTGAALDEETAHSAWQTLAAEHGFFYRREAASGGG